MKHFITFLKVLGYIPITLIIWFFAAIVIFFLAFKMTAESLFQGKVFVFSKMVKL